VLDRLPRICIIRVSQLQRVSRLQLYILFLLSMIAYPLDQVERFQTLWPRFVDGNSFLWHNSIRFERNITKTHDQTFMRVQPSKTLSSFSAALFMPLMICRAVMAESGMA
jgi:hypothetical protein